MRKFCRNFPYLPTVPIDPVVWYTLIDSNFTTVLRSHQFASHTLCPWPTDITVHDSSVIIVCPFYNNIHIFDIFGNRVSPPVGRAGEEDGQFIQPLDVVTDLDGRLYVADFYNYRIMLFSPAGQFLQNLVTREDGLVNYPRALFLHGKNLYVITRSERLYHFIL